MMSIELFANDAPVSTVSQATFHTAPSVKLPNTIAFLLMLFNFCLSDFSNTIFIIVSPDLQDLC